MRRAKLPAHPTHQRRPHLGGNDDPTPSLPGGWLEDTILERDAAGANRTDRAKSAWELARTLWARLDDQQVVQRINDEFANAGD